MSATILRRRLLAASVGLACAALASGGSPAVAAAERRILVFGDSQAQGLAAAMLRAFRADRATRVLDRSKIGTGLRAATGRAPFDWVSGARVLAGAEAAGVAVAMFGANDRPPPAGDTEAQEVRLQRFMDDYGARVTEVARIFRDARVPLVWVGHPVVRDEGFAEDMGVLNDIAAEAAGAEGAVFVSSWEMFRGPDGAYAAYGPGRDGATARLRADDGVHLSPAGYDVLAAAVLPEVERLLAAAGR